MSEAYSDVVLRHFRDPCNVGILKNPDGVGRVENPASGASIELYLRIDDHKVVQARFKSQGCTATIAASSVLTTMVAGRSIGEVGRISRGDIEQALGGLPPTKKHAAALAEDAIQAAILDFRKAATPS